MSMRLCLTKHASRITWGANRFSSYGLCVYRRHSSGEKRNESATEQHKLFIQQIEELDQERQNIFGQDSLRGNIPTVQLDDSVSVPPVTYTDNLIDVASSVQAQDNWKHEREVLYGFTASERDAWSTLTNQKHSTEYLQKIERARDEHYASHQSMDAPVAAEAASGTDSAIGHFGFSHLAMDGTTVKMVDVGPKVAAHRTATAQSMVTFPEAVLTALGRSGDGSTDQPTNELVGPKGPIFATSITAGIMAAKQTSNLIPLCHPLPLENVHVEIWWTSRKSITIECTCSVTHKTGVEMEALVGASVAALTVYDMVKAVSHDVQIDGTRLIRKSGGKRDVDKRYR